MAICGTQRWAGMQTCFQLPAVLTTPTNRASPSEVPAAPARSDQRALPIAEKQWPAGDGPALPLVVQRRSEAR